MTVTCNRGEFLEKNLREQFLSGHFDLEGIDFDIVVVDDGSADGTFDRISGICNNEVGIPLTYIYTKRRLGSQFYSDSTIINTGVLHSTGDFLYIASSDCYICNSDAFQRLIKIDADKYMSPHMFRFDQKGSALYKFCTKNWMDPTACVKFYEENDTPWGAAYYDRILGTGLIGMQRQTFIDAGGIPPIRTSGGTDAAMLTALGNIHAANVDEDASELIVVHFPVPYAIAFVPGPAKYLDEHYTKVDGITVVADEYLEIHNLKL